MKSDSILTIFSSYSDSGERSAPLVFSTLIHGITCGIIFSVLLKAPRIVTPAHAERYSPRYLEFNSLAFQLRHPATAKMREDNQSTDRRPSERVADQLSAYLHPARHIAPSKRGLQTLVQADLPKQIDVPVELPLPQFLIWKPHPLNAKSIVAPLPEPSHASDANPSIVAPNQETQLGNISIAATTLPTPSGQSLAATTTPISVHQAAMTQKAPVTVSQTFEKPTPVAIMSLSDLRMSDGKAVLPPINDTAGVQTQGESSTTEATIPLQTAIRTSVSTGTTPKRQGANGTAFTEQGSTEMSQAQHDQTSPQDGNSLLGPKHDTSATLITLPKDGRFAAVVVGTSPDDRFPEIETRWGGRLIYTVYLHVGLAHSWILQYSLPRSAEALASGRVVHLDAPWPYSMIRPDLDFDSIGADALILNGFITQDGTFEKLSLISPPSFPDYDFVIHCLQRWKFRPAAQDGRSVPVEVMLIIPIPLS